MRTARQTADAVRQLETLGRLGCMVSVACGPSGGGPCGWSVLVAMPDGRVFEEPYAATDFADAVAIAEREVTRRRGVLSRMLPDGQLGGLGAADPLAPLLPVRSCLERLEASRLDVRWLTSAGQPADDADHGFPTERLPSARLTISRSRRASRATRQASTRVDCPSRRVTRLLLARPTV